MVHVFLPLLATLLLWWGATGVILLLATRPHRVARSMLVVSVLAVAACGGILATVELRTVGAAYLSFGCGLLVWGWVEMTYLTGLVTGPPWSQVACPQGASETRRFLLGIQTSLYHELLVILAGVVIWLLSLGAANQVGAWTYSVLWVMRWSAKLNLFLGVPNLNSEFFPQHLRHLDSYIKRRAMNLLFPISVTAGTWVASMLVMTALATTDDFVLVAHMCLATLMALAVLEHWFMVLPLQDAELWRWALPGEQAARTRDPESAPLPEAATTTP